MNEEHVFVDLECLGNGTRAPVVSIAAVKFEPQHNYIGTSLHINTIPPDCAQYSYDTVMWWLRQPEAARDALNALPPIDLRSALIDLTAFVNPSKYIWARGTDYDLRILREWYQFYNETQPAALSSFLGWRDSRCITDLLPDVYRAMKDHYTGHIATHDCFREIRTIQRVYEVVMTYGRDAKS